MTRSELDLLLKSESNRVEWKAGGNPETIAKTLAAFANDFEDVGSGSVICGVEECEAGAVVRGLSPVELKSLQDKIFESTRRLVSPPLTPRFDTVDAGEGNQVLVAWVAASGELHSFRDKIFIRSHDKVIEAKVTEIGALSLRKQNSDWLAQPCPGATTDDVDLFSLEDLARRLRVFEAPATLLAPGFRFAGSALPLTARVQSPAGESVAPTRFAVLLVGSEPHRFFPGAFVSLTRFGSTTRAGDSFALGDVHGPIPRLVEKIMDVFETETGFVADKSQDAQSGRQNRRRYSPQALQEMLVNALAHRNYQDSRSTKIAIFSDRIEFENPCGTPGEQDVEKLKKGVTRWPNPALARYLFELGFAQERGSGIPRAFHETMAISGREPVLEVGEWFKVTVPAYEPPSLRANGEPVNPGSGVLVISIGYGTINLDIIRRSHPAFKDLRDEEARLYPNPGVVTGERWPVVVRSLRDWLRACIEQPDLKEGHLFYRGPVALGPLIGAIAAGRKPLVIYYFDEDESVYRSAYRIDRNLLQAE